MLLLFPCVCFHRSLTCIVLCALLLLKVCATHHGLRHHLDTLVKWQNTAATSPRTLQSLRGDDWFKCGLEGGSIKWMYTWLKNEGCLSTVPYWSGVRYQEGASRFSYGPSNSSVFELMTSVTWRGKHWSNLQMTQSWAQKLIRQLERRKEVKNHLSRLEKLVKKTE